MQHKMKRLYFFTKDEGQGWGIFFLTENVEEGWRGKGETKAKNETLQNERKVSLKFFIFYRLHVSYFLLHFFPHFPLPYFLVDVRYFFIHPDAFFSLSFIFVLPSASLCSTRKIFIFFPFHVAFSYLNMYVKVLLVKVPFMKCFPPWHPSSPLSILYAVATTTSTIATTISLRLLAFLRSFCCYFVSFLLFAVCISCITSALVLL